MGWADRGIEIKTPDQIDDARAFCERHGEPSQVDDSPTWRLLVSPAKGTFSRVAEASGTVAPLSSIGQVTSLREATQVVAPHGGTIVEWLVEDGDLVSPGQPLLRLHPEGVPA